MTTFFRHLASFQSRADYDKTLRKALGTPGVQPFYYLDEFPFDKGESPLVLVGDVAKPDIDAARKLAPKASFAKGQCTVQESGKIVFEVESGKVQLRLLSNALKASGVKSPIALGGEEEEEEVKPGVGLSEQGKQWQEKVKLLRPAFEKTLLKAKSLKDPTWAQDLDGTFSQMLQEAKKGDFDAAMKSMALLVRVMKSEESARAEVKHETGKQMDSDYASTTEEIIKNNKLNPEGVERTRQDYKEMGINTTGDRVQTYARAVTPDEWGTKAIKPMQAMILLAKKEKPDFEKLKQLYGMVDSVTAQLNRYAHETDGRRNDLLSLSSDLRFDLDVVKDNMDGLALIAEEGRKDTKKVASECDDAINAIAKHMQSVRVSPTNEDHEWHKEQVKLALQERESMLEEMKMALDNRAMDLLGMRSRLDPNLQGNVEWKQLEFDEKLLKEAQQRYEQDLRDLKSGMKGNYGRKINNLMEVQKRFPKEVAKLIKALHLAGEFLRSDHIQMAIQTLDAASQEAADSGNPLVEGWTKLTQHLSDVRTSASKLLYTNGRSVSLLVAKLERAEKGAAKCLKALT